MEKKMYTLHVQSNTTDTSALSGKEMPCHPSAGTHGGWPALATVAQNKLLSHQRQRLRTYFTYSTPLLWFFYDFYFILFFFHVLGQRARSFATCLSALSSVRKNKIIKKKYCFILAQPKPALQHSAVLDSSISSDCVSVWMSTISRFSCTDPKKKCSERHTQKQAMGKEGSGSPGAGEQRRVQRKHDGTRYGKKKKKTT